ncbi:MAG: hypothetical protein ACYDEQ_03255 [Desulfocucumaceae bacterium]
MKKNIFNKSLPTVLFAICNKRIEDWIKEYFQNQIGIINSLIDPDAIEEKITQLSPDIFVIMRQNSLGGIPDAGRLAALAARSLPAVLFIVGELDDEGREMYELAREAGVPHIITCEKGGQIYGDELVYGLASIIKEIKSPGQNTRPEEVERSLSNEAKSTINAMFQGAGAIGRAIIQSAGTVSDKARAKSSQKKSEPKINRSAGISIDESGVVGENKDKLYATAIVPGGILVIVTPWRPNLAGRLASQAVKMLSEVEGCEVAYIGATGKSTGALWLDIPEEELMMSDWRIPGSNYPIIRDNCKIFTADPVKNLTVNSEEPLWNILRQAGKTATYMVIDCADDIAMAQKAARSNRAVLLAVIPGNDPVEQKLSSIWVKNIMDGSGNIVTGIDLRGAPLAVPENLQPRVIIKNNPADALQMALKKSQDNVFVWN